MITNRTVTLPPLKMAFIVVMRKKGKERKKEKRTHTHQPLAGAVETPTTATLGTEERGSCGEVAVMGRKIYFRQYCATFLRTLSHYGNPIIYNIQR